MYCTTSSRLCARVKRKRLLTRNLHAIRARPVCAGPSKVTPIGPSRSLRGGWASSHSAVTSRAGPTFAPKRDLQNRHPHSHTQRERQTRSSKSQIDVRLPDNAAAEATKEKPLSH
eukprot:2445618-Prymnesium_polylepis.1